MQLNHSSKQRLFAGVDRLTILYYLLIVIFGCLCITSASSEDSVGGLFSFSHFYTKQIVWMGVSLFFALIVLLLDASIFHKFAYVAYGGGLLLLIATLFIGETINGAKAWINLGVMNWQPVEVVKIATALALARLMSEYNFSIDRPDDLIRVGLLLLAPLAIIVMQNDTGSGIVLGSFLFVLYREGLNKWICIPILVVAALFIISFLLSPIALLVLMLVVCTLSEAMMNKVWRSRIIFLAWIFLGSLLLYFTMEFFWPASLSYYGALLISALIGALVAAIYALRTRLMNIFVMLALFLSSLLFLDTTDYLFNSVLKPHQQNRIKVFLGILDDPNDLGYNVNQSKIAIGSGGFLGKGFMEGTQIKFGYVPEKHTDFIFCTVGEEWGFVGTIGLLTLFCLLILRLMRMGERQAEPFGRIYCYCVASILLFHVMVNVGMTIGLMPVMGIPLPFMSYGGSSLMAFTVLLFIAIRLDASTRTFNL
uniref:rod shape-determining protein RodA n=1 Tax=Alistipes sp. TaxID=1872444 RepID=UPI00405739FE